MNNMNDRYRCQDEDLTIEHHFRIGIFIVAIDFQLQELKSRFCELTSLSFLV